MGTAAIFTINSAYVFLVYEQTQEIPIATAKQAEQETTAAGAAGPVPTFFLSTLFQKLTAFYVPGKFLNSLIPGGFCLFVCLLV